MNNKIIAYNIPELEKKEILSEALNLYKSHVLSKEQWNKIQVEFATKLYSPSVIMKVMSFIVALIGMSTIMGPFALLFNDLGEAGYQILMFLLGIALIVFTEIVLIKQKLHYKTGVTEAGIYMGLSFVALGILGFESHSTIVYPLVGFFFAAFAAIRYLNVTSLALTLGFLGWIVFQLLYDVGGIFQALMPFVFMIVFGFIYWGSKRIQTKLPFVFLTQQFLVIQTLSLILLYVAGNYYVVRELSVQLLGLTLSEHQDFPYAFLFYGLTALVPLAYLYWGIKQKSVMFIRVGLLTLALSVITFKYYFSLGMPIITFTISGAFLIVFALIIMNYLKQPRHGFTREKLLSSKWNSPDLIAVIASQTLGGSQIKETPDSAVKYGGGSFGGGGAEGKW